MKQCYRCKRQKPLDLFPREKRNKDGRNGSCKECVNAANRALGGSVPTPDEKVCTRCGELKAKEFYGRNSWRKDGLHSQCQECRRNPAKDYQLQRNYGISLEEYDRMLSEQGGVCKICNRPPKTKALAVDHCHQTGRVRGLLCWPCNRFLGHIGDDQTLLRHMIEYLHHELPEPSHA